MDPIAEHLEKQYNLELSPLQIQEIDKLFIGFMREYHFPIQWPVNSKLLQFKYLKEFIRLLTTDQFEKFQIERIAEKKQRLIRNKKSKERINQGIQRRFSSVNLNEEQVNIIATILQARKDGKFKNTEVRTRIKIALENELSKEQKDALTNVFKLEDDHKIKNKIEKAIEKYSFIKIDESQAKKIIELDKLLYTSESYKIIEELKEVLTSDQFEAYKNHKKELKKKVIASQIEDDQDMTEKLIQASEWSEFIIKEILNEKCHLRKQLINTASNEDKKMIDELKSEFEKRIKDRKIKIKTKHFENYDDKAPIRLKTKLSRISSHFLNPPPQLLEELDLDKNMFSSIKLNSEQELMLKSFKLKIRNFKIEMLERKLKSYASLMSSSGNHFQYKYDEFYSLLLLDNEPEKNIEKSKMILS